MTTIESRPAKGPATTNVRLRDWVDTVAALTQPDRIVWCDGSQDEWDRLTAELVASGTFTRLNPDKRPNSFLARSGSRRPLTNVMPSNTFSKAEKPARRLKV